MRRPFNQGDLDGLCGVYAVINAVDCLCGPLSASEARYLFKHIVRYLNTRVVIAERLSEGFTQPEIAGVLKHIVCRRYSIRRYKPFHLRPDVGLDDYWYSLQAAFDQSPSVALIGMSGRHHHWTLVKRVTAKTLILKDSSGLRYLARRHCSLFNDFDGNKPHWLMPSHTYILTLR